MSTTTLIERTPQRRSRSTIQTGVGAASLIAVAMKSNVLHLDCCLALIRPGLLVYCPDSDYAANVELAEAVAPAAPRPAASQSLTKLHTPNVKTIAELCAFLKIPAEKTVKAVVVDGAHGFLEAHGGDLVAPGGDAADAVAGAALDDLVEHVGIDGREQLAVVAQRVHLHFVGDDLVALAVDDVQHRQRADELRERRDHDRPAQLGAHARALFQHLAELVRKTGLRELRLEVADHAAGNLVLEVGAVVFGRHAQRLAFVRRDPAEARADFVDQPHRVAPRHLEVVGDLEAARIDHLDGVGRPRRTQRSSPRTD